ncbi:energy-coupling factor ABC transporter ATP-binding protein [Microbacterium sp. zg.Y1090]|uniref:energy-coupling factor ABC transporter ATP-binding protein n=1 Tax=Microbacterium TaxID=33882 RepID=UPI00214B739D|nr:MULTISPECIES: ABC transporter ATP-binding protein [unclassified Microbacterium]MCR2811558.1 energy-coupling factor ABC transporter ATP-binding protein [Microbacterium sp. zg.Y1084]MCR2819020.1 energy-coupling factor ABC transporter ATP-binding protein [Microbacterium sp. zg.Y1090]MDL5487670.1 ABC transporter ATP-binding protein [Microbacterium sp. zg-Y1211]WIM27325.1 ABC transporter ATP-binding protein [Microbacterium sp. zg-Y1090]
MSSAAVSVRSLHYRYPGTRAQSVLAGVDFDITAGERVAILGPNGAGKTTLMLHLNGILMPDEGWVDVDGTRIDRDTVREVRRRVGLVFQDPDDQLFMPTVGEDVAFGPANYGVAAAELRARVDGALATVGLHDVADRQPQHLSLGQRRRAAIATILSMDVDVMVLDEPTSNLDPGSRRELSATLAALPATQIVVTHDLPYALELCPRALILDGGRIVADGPTRSLLSDAALMAAHGLELPWGFDPSYGRR